MTSRSALRRLLKEAAEGVQVSKDAIEVLGRLNEELLEEVAERAAEIREEAEAGRVDVEDVLQAWRERVNTREDYHNDDGGPRLHVGRQTHASLAPRHLPKTDRFNTPKTLTMTGDQHEVK